MTAHAPPPLSSGCRCEGDSYDIRWVEPHVAVGAMPCRQEHVELLHGQGIDSVLNLCAEFCDLPDMERQFGLSVHYLPIDDMGVPDADALEESLDWMEERIAAGGKVFIHCRFGMGRTGTVLACWLARRGLRLEDVVRDTKNIRAKPFSFAQNRFVRDFAARHGVAHRGALDGLREAVCRVVRRVSRMFGA